MIYYEKKGQGIPVVLIHGFPNDHHTWDPIIDRLLPHGMYLLPDLPGAGRSALVPNLTITQMADSIAAMLQAEHIDKAIIAGHSMGGYTAMNFAARYPEKVKGISLIHSTATADSDEKKAQRRKAIALITKGETEKMTFLNAMAQNLFAPSFAAANPAAVASVVQSGSQLSIQALTEFYSAIMHRPDTTPVLQNATFPVQWILGTEDQAVPFPDVLKLVYRAPVNQVSIYEDCGHMSMMEQPATLCRDVIRFIDFVGMQ